MKQFFVVLAVLAISLVGAMGVRADGVPVEKTGVYKYEAPTGWAVQKGPMGGDVAMKKDATGNRVIDVEVDHAPGELRTWAEASVARNKKQFAQFNAKFSDLVEFQTAAGAKGYKVTVSLQANGNDLHMAMYIFSGSKDAKIVATCSCLAAEAGTYDPQFDAAMKTFVAE